MYSGVILINIILQVGFSSQFAVDRTENTKTDRSLKTSGNLLAPYADVDPKSCHCLPPTKQCKLAIAKSSALEITCPENQHYCCDVSGKEVPSGQREYNETANKVIESGVRIRVITDENKWYQSSESKDPKLSITTDDNKPQTRCDCRTREDCEDRYTDYSFGFHCSYDKVRCCQPEDQIQKEMYDKSGGRLITIRNENNLSDKGNYQCYCVSAEECLQMDFNIEQDRTDIQCPFHRVKCCGISTMDRKGDKDVEFEELDSSIQSKWLPLSDVDEQGAGVNIHGQPGFRQPIQLPVLKIPVNDSSPPIGNHPLQKSGSISNPRAEVVISPPELPHSYHKVNGQPAQPPPLYQSGVQRPPIYQYYGNVGSRPVGQTNSVPIIVRYNINTPPEASERSQEPSFLDKVTNFFFG